jgi:23S rRNA (uracil1939-C5)-methyltransferase
MDTYELTLTTLTYGGDCLGRLPDGRAAFVPYALPGERVRVRIVEEKRGHVRAELVEIITSSPDRIQPRCPHHYRPHPQPLSQGERGWG